MGFSGLIHKFDAGIKYKFDLNQCLFEVKYRVTDVTLEQEDIMKFHQAHFEYFLKLLTEQRWDEANVSRCFVTTKEVRDRHRHFFYAWGITLIDPLLRPLPCLPEIFERCQEQYGTSDQILELVERANRLTERACFSLADLVPPEQKYGNVLDLDKLNPAVDSANILAEHKYLQNKVETLQQRYRQGRHQ